MNKILLFLSRPATFISAILLITGFLIFVLPGESEKAAMYTPAEGSFDLSFFYPPGSVYPAVEAYGDSGRAAYIRSRWTFDLVFPLAYTFFSLTGAAFFLRLQEFRRRRLLLVPLAGMVFDFLENTAVSIMMAAWPRRIPLLPWISSLATPLKWIFVVTGMGIVVFLGIGALIRRLRRT